MPILSILFFITYHACVLTYLIARVVVLSLCMGTMLMCRSLMRWRPSLRQATSTMQAWTANHNTVASEMAREAEAAFARWASQEGSPELLRMEFVPARALCGILGQVSCSEAAFVAYAAAGERGFTLTIPIDPDTVEFRPAALWVRAETS